MIVMMVGDGMMMLMNLWCFGNDSSSDECKDDDDVIVVVEDIFVK